jgi:hypothetical protein
VPGFAPLSTPLVDVQSVTEIAWQNQLVALHLRGMPVPLMQAEKFM